MIVCKPKVGTLISLGIFVAICLSVSGYTFQYIQSNQNNAWYLWLIIVLLAPLSLGLLTKTILGYKIVQLGKGKVNLSYPTRFFKKSYSVKQVTGWKEESVKTSTGNFQELKIQFDDKRKLSLSLQEHTGYKDVVRYLKSKCKKLQIHD